jgi:deoxycytidylate deaminase
MLKNDTFDFLQWLKVAQDVAASSPHPTVKVGAVLIDFHGRMIASAANGYALGVETTEERTTSDFKSHWIECAENTTISNAAKNGAKTEGGTLCSTLFPCYRCAGQILTAGIRRVIVPDRLHPFLRPETLRAIEIGQKKLSEGKVEVIKIALGE